MLVCSSCHTRFVKRGEAHVVCPNCQAEAGLESVKPATPRPMKLFGAALATAGVLVVLISGFVAAGN